MRIIMKGDKKITFLDMTKIRKIISTAQEYQSTGICQKKSNMIAGRKKILLLQKPSSWNQAIKKW